MKKMQLFLILSWIILNENVLYAASHNGADVVRGADFVTLAKKVAPSYYTLYVAGKREDEYFAIYEPTSEEPRMKEEERKKIAHDAWYERKRIRNWQDDPSDPEPETYKVVYYELFKCKVGSKDNLKDVPKVHVTRYRGSGEEIHFLDKILYLPGFIHNKPRLLPVDPKLGPQLLRDKFANVEATSTDKDALRKLKGEELCNAVYEKLHVKLFDIKK